MNLYGRSARSCISDLFDHTSAAIDNFPKTISDSNGGLIAINRIALDQSAIIKQVDAGRR